MAFRGDVAEVAVAVRDFFNPVCESTVERDQTSICMHPATRPSQKIEFG